MNAARGDKIAEVLKNTENLKKSLKLTSAAKAPNAPPPEPKNSVGQPVQGSGFVKILVYVIAGILSVALILLAIDQWITPIFQRSPGSAGYIPIPGIDTSQVFWLTPSDVDTIIIGSPPPSSSGTPPLSTTVIEGQDTYSITMDLLIQDEYPQTLGTGQNQRIFFVLSQRPENPSIRISLDNNKNAVNITCFDTNGLQQTVTLDNVPIHVPFRVGFTISPFLLEGYLNGLLVKTRQLNSVPKSPRTGDKIFAPADIILGGNVMSTGIKVLNVRCFGYKVAASEMSARNGDVRSLSVFNTKTVVTR